MKLYLQSPTALLPIVMPLQLPQQIAPCYSEHLFTAQHRWHRAVPTLNQRWPSESLTGPLLYRVYLSSIKGTTNCLFSLYLMLTKTIRLLHRWHRAVPTLNQHLYTTQHIGGTEQSQHYLNQRWPTGACIVNGPIV